jgi:hypothetical protein
VNSYLLSDHQFIQVNVNISGEEATVWIPRNILVTVFESNAGTKSPISFDAAS